MGYLRDYNKESKTKMTVTLDNGQVVEGEFIDIRIDLNTIPSDKKRFSIRHSDDDGGEPASLIDGGCLVNFFGVLICDKNVELPEPETCVVDYDYLDN